MCSGDLKPEIKPHPSTAVVAFLLPRVGAEKCWGMRGGPVTIGGGEDVPVPSSLSLWGSLSPQDLFLLNPTDPRGFLLFKALAEVWAQNQDSFPVFSLIYLRQSSIFMETPGARLAPWHWSGVPFEGPTWLEFR